MDTVPVEGVGSDLEMMVDLAVEPAAAAVAVAVAEDHPTTTRDALPHPATAKRHRNPPLAAEVEAAVAVVAEAGEAGDLTATVILEILTATRKSTSQRKLLSLHCRRGKLRK